MHSDSFRKLKAKAILFRSDTFRDRRDRLQKIKVWIQVNESKIIDALRTDFKKPAFETQISEILPVLNEISFAQKNLKKWMRERKVKTPLTLFGHQSRIRYENKGCVLIISPWNYPFQLALVPLVSALAAGNTAVIKPSELTPRTSVLIHQMMTECFSTDEVTVSLGGKEKTQELLTYKFDHVFFTGSTAVGRLIAQACAERLIPMTLELGGKSPTIVDETANLTEAADKIFWGKFINRGQTCIAPDFVLVHESALQDLQKQFQLLIHKHQNDEKARIITEKHQQRLQAMALSDTSLNQDVLKILVNPASTTQVMTEEIFGPVLPLITYTSDADLFEKLKQPEAPLSLYIFSKRKNFIEKILSAFASGGVGINSVILQFGNHHLPFGGVRESGLGRYHGYFGFLEFSYTRSIIEQKFFPQLRFFMQPPYTNFKNKLAALAKRT
jgi:aldehyde dehydrogenase (NAD+)